MVCYLELILCSCSKRLLLLELTFIVFLLKILLNLLSLGKCLSINVRKIFAILEATLMLEGRVEQVIFPFVVLFFSLFLLVYVTSNWRFVLYPFFFRASVYGGRASLNIWAFLELVDRRLSMLFGRFLIIEGGWLLCLWIYVKLLFGF